MSIALIPVAIHVVKATKGALTDDGAKLTLGVIGVLAFSVYLKPGAPLPPPMRLLREGSRSVVADSGFHRTAIKRSSPSKPFAHFRAQGLVTGQVLDFGSGRGADCRGTKIRCYDPNHPTAQVRNLPRGPFDTVAAIYVVNVLPKPQRHAALRKAGARVKRGGHLLLAARGQGDEGFEIAQSGWVKRGDGFIQTDTQGELQRFQRFYRGDQALRQEASKVLGASFQSVPVPSLGSDMALAAFRRIR
jgi:hypothetical protein